MGSAYSFIIKLPSEFGQVQSPVSACLFSITYFGKQVEMVGWHHRFNAHERGPTLEDGEGHGGLACCSPWGHKELDMTQELNNNNLFSAGLMGITAQIKMEKLQIRNARVIEFNTKFMIQPFRQTCLLLLEAGGGQGSRLSCFSSSLSSPPKSIFNLLKEGK